jgi:hypothetical protein
MHSDLQAMGRFLVDFGVILVVVGALCMLGGKVPWLGRLPGDIAIRRDGWSFYVPITTCLLLSALISLIAWVVRRR